MNKEYILKNNYDFQRIIKNNKPIKSKGFIIYIEKNSSNEYHFGFSVGKKMGNAVTRNRIKRQLKSIVSKKDYQKGFNCIIIVSNNILKKSYAEMQSNLIDVFKKLEIIKENVNEEK